MHLGEDDWKRKGGRIVVSDISSRLSRRGFETIGSGAAGEDRKSVCRGKRLDTFDWWDVFVFGSWRRVGRRVV